MNIFSLTKISPPLVIILPTGAGKSTFFFLPAILEPSGCSIIVVPYISLLDNLVERIKELKIDFIVYKGTDFSGDFDSSGPRPAPLILVSADVVYTGQFQVFLQGLASRRVLKRVFIDEAHLFLTEKEFRPNLPKIKVLLR